MTSSLVIDGLIVVAVFLAAWSGWRQGALSATLSFVGVVSGVVLGMAVAPMIMRTTDQVALRFLLAIGILVLFVGIGQLIGSSIGLKLRDRMRRRSSQRADSAVGAVFQAVAALLVIWLVSIPVSAGLTNSVGQGLRNSQILGEVYKVAPAPLTNLPSGLAGMLNDSGLPLIAPWQAEGGDVQVDAPDVAVSDQDMVKRVRPSVVHVLGDAEVCSRRLMGSGFVVDDGYVVTNAHVVAGTNTVNLDTVLGIKESTVVYYNPEVDIAVLHTDGLNLPALPWASQPAGTSDDGIVMGFPLSGPFDASPVRVRDRITIAGPDIYSQGRVEREAYTVRGTILQGNSGGPMLNSNGEVLGVVFGASVDDAETGYALTAEEVRSHIGDVASLSQATETGKCVSG